ncbi:hypothetical protein C8R46DRAFT_668757 [Mycena filopes]|nr:hypothetical protein C8R46DRAFT_668757 [Mycena filopes]
MALLTLPNELLVAIAAAGSRPAEDLTVVQRRYRCEWTLSQVSRRLREVIIGAPTLWTLLELDLHHEELTEIAQLYLTRSRACHVSVLLHETRDIDNDDLIAERIRVLLPHLSRIRTLRLSIYVDPGVALSPLRHVLAPNLERLEILNNLDPSDFHHTAFEIFSLGLPKLTSFEMKHAVPHLPLPPWTVGLTRLEFRSDDLGVAATIITQSPSLVHLSLGLVDLTIGRLCLPSLKFLRISIESLEQDYLPAVFDLFDTPALTEFTIHGTHAHQILTLLHSASLPHSSFPALKSLTFANGADDCRTFPPGVQPIPPPRLFPVLSSLTLIRLCFTSDLVGKLASTAHPWPLLKTLTVCPSEREVVAVSDVLWNNARSAKHRALPRFRLSDSLLTGIRRRERKSGEESGMDMELFDPTELIAAFQ